MNKPGVHDALWVKSLPNKGVCMMTKDVSLVSREVIWNDTWRPSSKQTTESPYILL